MPGLTANLPRLCAFVDNDDGEEWPGWRGSDLSIPSQHLSPSPTPDDPSHRSDSKKTYRQPFSHILIINSCSRDLGT